MTCNAPVPSQVSLTAHMAELVYITAAIMKMLECYVQVCVGTYIACLLVLYSDVDIVFY